MNTQRYKSNALVSPKANESYNESIFENYFNDCSSTELLSLDETFDGDVGQKQMENSKSRNFQLGSRSEISKNKIKKDTVFNCLKCNAKFSKLSLFSIHNKFHSSSEDFSCGICQSSFKNVKRLTEHCLEHIEEQQNCPYCYRQLSSSISIKVHMKIHRIELEEAVSPQTELQNLQLNSSEDFTLHSIYQKASKLIGDREEIVQPIYFHCSKCRLILTSKIRLLIHMNSSHSISDN